MNPTALSRRAIDSWFFLVITMVLLGCTGSPDAPQALSKGPAEDETYDGFGEPDPNAMSGNEESVRWAILVGINDYGEDWGPLRCAVNGAFRVRNVLRDEFGYRPENLKLLVDEEATEGAIISAIEEVERSRVTSRDSLLFYFAGHGTPEGRLVAIDSSLGASKGVDGTRGTAGLTVAKIRSLLVSSLLRYRAVVLDTCFSGTIFEEIPPAQSDSNGVFICLTAARPTDFAFDGRLESELSPFTWHFLDVLKKRANSERSDHSFSFKQLASQMTSRASGPGTDPETTESNGADRDSLRMRVQPHWGLLGPGKEDFMFRETFRRATPVEQERERKEQERIASLSRQVALASRGCRMTHPQRSLLLANEAFRVSSAGAKSTDAHQNLRDALTEIGGTPLTGHEGGVGCLVISPDDRWLFSCGADDTVRAWNLGNDAPPTIVAKHLERITDLGLSPDGRYLAAASTDGSMSLLTLNYDDPGASSRTRRFHNSYIEHVEFSKNGKWLASASLDGYVRLWQFSGGVLPQEAIVLEGYSADADRFPIESLVFTNDSRFLIATCADRSCTVWELDQMTQSRDGLILHKHTYALRHATVSSDDRYLAAGDEEGTICLWNLDVLAANTEPRKLTGHGDLIDDLRFTPDGRLVSVGSDRTVRVWSDLESSPASCRVLVGHASGVDCIAIAPSGDTIATGSSDHTIRIWDIANDKATSAVLRGHEGTITALSFSGDGRWLFSASSDHTIRRWRYAGLETGTHSLAGDFNPAKYARSSSDGRWLVGQSYSGISLWELSNNDIRHHGVDLQSELSTMQMAGSRWLATGMTDGTLSFFDVTSKQPLKTKQQLINAHPDRISSIEFSPDMRWVASKSRSEASEGGKRTSKLIIWDLNSGTPKQHAVLDDPLLSFAFNADSSRLVLYDMYEDTAQYWDVPFEESPVSCEVLSGNNASIWSFDGRWLSIPVRDTVLVWDMLAEDPNESNFRIRHREINIEKVSFSPFNDFVAVATGTTLDAEHEVYLYALKSGKPFGTPHRLVGHENEICWILFDSAGDRLLTSAFDGDIRIWDLTSSDLHASCEILHDRDSGRTWLQLSADGRWLIANAEDAEPHLWDLKSQDTLDKPVILRGYEHASFISATGWLCCIRKRPSRFYGVRHCEVQPLDPHDLARMSARIAGRELTENEKQQFLLD